MTDNNTITVHIPDEINNLEDYIDSRDAQERIDYLAGIMPPQAYRDESEQHELDALIALKQGYIESFGEGSWSFGSQFIRESYFQDYAQELAGDVGAINPNATWPNNCIDWEQAAQELAMDYTTFDFDGVDYYAREA